MNLLKGVSFFLFPPPVDLAEVESEVVIEASNQKNPQTHISWQAFPLQQQTLFQPWIDTLLNNTNTNREQD